MTKFDISKYVSKDALNRLQTRFKDFYNKDNTRTVFATLGIAVLAIKSANFLAAIYRNFLRPGYNLTERYGIGSWVVITGASDGIGKSFAIELAALGFNIVLVARNKTKLEQVVEEIKKVRKDAETKIVIADFARSYEEDFYEKIHEEVKGLDISILINNVGLLQRILFNLTSPKYLFELTTVNTIGYAQTTKVFIDKLLAREKRTAIINLSSIVSDFAFGYNCLYAATKRYNDVQSKVLRAEYGDKIDILTLKPGYTVSQMTKRDIDLFTTDSTSYVKSALKRLGHTNETYGHWKHELSAFLIPYTPKSLITTKKFYTPENDTHPEAIY